jgi:Flp pilus assembly protein TadG
MTVRPKDRGAMSLEMVLLTPIFLAFIVLLAGAGRIVDAKSEVDGAARDAVRAASIARSESEASSLATQAATQSLGSKSWCRGGPTTVLDGSTNWGPGGQVAVVVTCHVDMGDLGFFSMFPGSKTMTGRSIAPIDTFTYRGG